MERTIEREPGGGGAGLRGLLEDPPLVDRLTWREGIRPQTLISEDRGLMARTFGTIYLVAALVGIGFLVLPGSDRRAELIVIGLTVFAAAASAAFFIFYRRTPDWAFQVATALGSIGIATAATTGPGDAVGGYGVFYVWVVLLSFLFFGFREALIQSAFAAATYAAVLIQRDTDFAVNYVLGLVAVLGSTGAMVGLLRLRLEQVAANLASQANTDPVTAIANRRSFDARFDFELLVADQADRPLSLVICDLDRFKVVNDELGHAEGDAALRVAANAIVNAVRSMDVVFRMGGEEFAVLLPNTEALEAYAVAERIRSSIRAAFDDYEVPLTVSCGLATRFPGTFGRKGLLRSADDALYRAKRDGRDRTVAHEGELAAARSDPPGP